LLAQAVLRRDIGEDGMTTQAEEVRAEIRRMLEYCAAKAEGE
jgi:hypothetical protein